MITCVSLLWGAIAQLHVQCACMMGVRKAARVAPYFGQDDLMLSVCISVFICHVIA